MLTLTELERRAYAADQRDMADLIARLMAVENAARTLLAMIDSERTVSPDVEEAAEALRGALE